MLIVSLNWLKHCWAISTLTLCSSISVDLTACQICLSFLTCPSCDGSIRGTFAAMSGMLRFASLGKRLRLPGGILPSLCDLFSLLSLIFSSNQDDNFFLINSLNNSVLFIKINWINQWSSCYTSWQFNPFVYIYLSVQNQNKTKPGLLHHVSMICYYSLWGKNSSLCECYHCHIISQVQFGNWYKLEKILPNFRSPLQCTFTMSI